MPAAKNLIGLKQLRLEQISGYMLQVASGFVVVYNSGMSGALVDYVDYVSGLLTEQIDNVSGGGGNSVTGFRAPIASGVDTIHVLYGTSYNPTLVVGSIGCSGASDPLIFSMVTNTNATGAVVELSETTNSSNYYLNLLVPV